MRYDVVIVGARCAGAAIATHLARAGASVALLDAATLPSDQGCSTHLIQPAGVDELDALGVGQPVRGLAPAIEIFRQAFDDVEVQLPYEPRRAARCLRRGKLDALMQNGAAEAGADLQPRSRVVGLRRDAGGRVCGVEVRRGGGATERIDADLVVGADGRNSAVAKLAGAREYLGYDGPRAAYWAYWRRPSSWDPREALNSWAGDGAWVVFPTDEDQLLVATAPPLARARAWRGRHTAAYEAEVRSHDRVASHLGAGRPLGKVRGVVSTRYFFRTSAGPGWALIGDAGHHKEFAVGLGISDALRDARAVAEAVLSGDPRAIRAWWRQRDVERLEMFHWSRDLGRAQPVNGLQRIAAATLASRPDLRPRFAEIIDGRRSPYDLIPAGDAVRAVAAALGRGERGLLAPLGRTAARRLRASVGRRARSIAHAHEVQPMRRGRLAGVRPRAA